MPVIAAVHGHALGGGMQIALGTDIRIVHPDTQLSVREVHWGLVPDMTGTFFLAQLVGVDGADDLLVPHREELRVARLLHHEARQEHGPVELAEDVGRVDHRQRLVGDLLLAAEEAHRDHHDAALLLGGEVLEVARVRLVVELARVPELPHRLLVLAVDGTLHHLAREAQSRFERALGLLLDRRHPLTSRTLKPEVMVMIWRRTSRRGAAHGTGRRCTAKRAPWHGVCARMPIASACGMRMRSTPSRPSAPGCNGRTWFPTRWKGRC